MEMVFDLRVSFFPSKNQREKPPLKNRKKTSKKQPFFNNNQAIISKNFVTTLIRFTRICPFHLTKKKTRKMAFLDVEISRENS